MSRILRKIRRGFWYMLYASVGKRLPPSYGCLGGKYYKAFRIFLARRLLAQCGTGANVEHGASFGTGNNIYLGNHSDLGINCEIHGEVHIGDYAFMGPHVIIWTTNHRFDRLDIPMALQGTTEPKPVYIGNDVWIGTRAILLAGVRIGNGAIVGAAAVVTKDVPDYAIVGGNPARIIRYRKPQESAKEIAVSEVFAPTV